MRDTAAARGVKIEEKDAPHGADLEGLFEPVQEGSRVWRWLTEIRCLSAETIRMFRLGQARLWFGPEAGERDCVAFPSYDAAGVLRFVKFRDIENKHNVRPAPKKSEGAPKMLFGIQAAGSYDPETDSVIVCEGEVDAMTWRQAGYGAVSVPFGAKGLDSRGRNPNDEWIKHDFEWLDKFERVYLAFDADEAGRAAIPAIAPRMGIERTYVVDYPEDDNDANGMLKRGAADEDFFDLYHAARDMDPQDLKRSREYEDDLWEQMFGEGLRFSGDEMPFAVPFRLRRKEVTVWTGYSKHGKTVFLNWLLMSLAARYGRRGCVASLEMPVIFTLENAARQVMGKPRPNGRPEFGEIVEFLDGHLFLYDRVGVVESGDIFEVFRYAVRKYGVDHLVIDSIMKLEDVIEEDNDSQKQFMNRATAFAEEMDVHVHIVAHSKKATQKYPEEKYWPKKHDVLGSVHITDIAHNTVCVYRNRKKENDVFMCQMQLDGLRRAGVPAGDERIGEIEAEMMEVEDRNDAMFIVEGQRGGGGFTPIKQLWFDKGEDNSWRYADAPGEFGGNWLEDAPGDAAADDDEDEPF